MASTSEVGHAKNVAHLATLITYCQSYGSSYNPSNNAIKVTQLNTLLTSAQTALTNVINDTTANTSAINARIVAFQNIKKLATRMYSALVASGATTQQKNNAKTINRKIQGSRAKITPPPTPTPTPTPNSNTGANSAEKTTTPPSVNPVPTPTPATPTTISTAQLSFDQLIQHMAAFIALLQSIPTYNPNETDLKITSLNTYLANLNSTNAAAILSHTNLDNARIARNKILYTPITGLCDIAEEVKDYIKSVYGSTAPEYKQVRGLSFKTRKL
jgi:hypothetical protein